MNARTEAYQRYGIHAITNLCEREAWLRHLQGKTQPLYDLPTNGDRCTEGTVGGSSCGFPILIDGTCPNAAEHGEVEIVVTDAMLAAAWREMPADVYCGETHLDEDTLRLAIAAALRAQGASDE